MIKKLKTLASYEFRGITATFLSIIISALILIMASILARQTVNNRDVVFMLAVFHPLLLYVTYRLGRNAGIGFLVAVFVADLYYMLSVSEGGAQMRLTMLMNTAISVLIWGFAYTANDKFEKDRLRRILNIEDLEKKFNLLQEKKEKLLARYMQSEKRVERYNQLNDVARQLSSLLEENDIARTIVERSRDIIPRGRVALLHRDVQTGTCTLLGVDETEKAKWAGIMEFDEWVINQNRVLEIDDMGSDFRFQQENIHDESGAEIQSLIGVPLHRGGKVIGVLRATDSVPGTFSQLETRALSIISDLASMALENAELYEKTEELAITDGLTGLYTHRYFQERLEDELTRAQQHETQLSFMMMDVDHFKMYNDTYGHQVGDRVLGDISSIIRSVVRNVDIPARYGGEEFAVILPETDREGARNVAERLRRVVEKHVVPVESGNTGLTISIGVACYPDDAKKRKKLVDLADKALYRAKELGRNRVVAHGDV